MPYVLGTKSKRVLSTARPPLQRVILRAIEITEVDFSVIEAIRTAEQQLALWKAKASKLNGIPKGKVVNGVVGTGIGNHPLGKAVDLAPYINGRPRYDWPLFFPIAIAVRAASIELNTPIIWGGVWDKELALLSEDIPQEMTNYASRRAALGKKVFHDGPHFELA